MKISHTIADFHEWRRRDTVKILDARTGPGKTACSGGLPAVQK
jgi:hypothetical protein